MVETRSTNALGTQNSQNASYTNHDTPTKSRIRQEWADIQLHHVQGARASKTAIFERHGVSKSRGYAILSEHLDTDRTAHARGETRGRKAKLSQKDLRHIEDLLDDADFWSLTMSYEAIITELDLECSVSTLRREIHHLNWWKCIACEKSWVHPDDRDRRVDWATVMKQKYPLKKDWYHVRFSDEVHFGIGPQGKVLIFRKPGMRYCSRCIQEKNEAVIPEIAASRRCHAWGSIGHKFKSNLEWYDIPFNQATKKDRNNGKMTAQVYHQRILQRVVQPWLERGDQFTLEEDQDSSHGLYNGLRPMIRI